MRRSSIRLKTCLALALTLALPAGMARAQTAGTAWAEGEPGGEAGAPSGGAAPPSASVENAAPDAAPAPAGTTAPPTVPPPPRPASPAASPGDRATCRVGDYAGFDEADARTAASLVCGELAARHPVSGRTYRVSLGKLGSVVVLSLAEELPDGSVSQHRQLTLSSIEEVPVAAPRLVDALLEQKPVAETETIDNLVGSDTRAPKKRDGDTVATVGVIGAIGGMEHPETSVGLDVALNYEAQRIAMGFDLRFAVITAEEGVGLFATGPYARYFFTNTDVTPYVGGGMGPMMMRVADVDFDGSRWGLGFWAEAGVELLRTHKSQLIVGARLDVPTFAVESGDESAFVLPVEIVAACNFD